MFLGERNLPISGNKLDLLQQLQILGQVQISGKGECQIWTWPLDEQLGLLRF